MSGTSLSEPMRFPRAEYCNLPNRKPSPVKGTPERAGLDTILAHFKDSELQLPVSEGSTEVRGLDDHEKMFLSEEAMLRYLKATKGKVKDAVTRLEATIVWKRTLGMWDIEAVAEEVAPEFESGKVTFAGYTRLSQPMLYTWTSKNVLAASPRQVKHMMFCMDRLIDLQLAGVPGVMFCADVSGKTQTQSGAMSVARQILKYLQAHYPERLGNAALLKLPWLGSLFVSLMWPFVDSDTSKKIHVNPDLSKDLVPKEILLEEYGGNLKHEFSMPYLDALVKLCLERRAGNLERWKAAGRTVGISEWDIFEPIPGSPSAGDTQEQIGNGHAIQTADEASKQA
ncbi:CRAL-TRIO domain-containing protein [Kockovaella imperatae]|uniref:CRAL-TRIO domain-containing protein n=1 Tax=Kockovaella imperatae TaxID=4999 RepID=A0A1Y1UDS5_9TREE|nr:CRAL-TRIO domain-containing protein [Kockovaella imperatae]ORX35674.1 CRAL-TRIO domain-containing protein [Kockovaella imperatae]